MKVRVGIVGGTGYTGVELLRILAQHPQARVTAITSRGEAGTRVDALFPNLRGFYDLAFSEPDPLRLADACDVVFFATPHGVAMDLAPQLLERGVKVIDLGADFRLRDPESFARWYGMDHRSRDWLAQAVYGLPETRRNEIREARLVANPGCYPTATQLGFLPLLERGLLDAQGLIADVKSGVSGAGRTARIPNLFCEAGDSFSAYAVAGHRHQPEIEQELSVWAGQEVLLTFVPHLTPMIRGIHATLYGRLSSPMDTAELQALFEARYQGEPFVDVLPAGSHPATRSVRGGNVCRIAVHQPRPGQIVVLSVIDNLVKGASGQAVQNMNLLFGLPEDAGLGALALLP
ncbi:N-acetyl-gamma-glutamyl-phosphate reductase [Thermithiobacillus plumbiphilus]|uniref:N-acetyl-gamma-glutamyl-phosphate reductase n=1 Tax=Thermithiobacillus plumbiphilus TaxID=1729899 RepID=A0ABU9D8H3_9PROT